MRIKSALAYYDQRRCAWTGPANGADREENAARAFEIKPENLAAATSRIFLGIRIECAQCHDHPFDTWKREEFWSYAAFFAGIESQQDGFFGVIREIEDRRELAIPQAETVVQATYLIP